MIKKVVIPAAGLGTRFLPATKAQPKEMLPIVDKPTIQYIVEEAIASGVNTIVIITGRSKRAIEDHFDKSIELELELEKKNNEKMLEMVQGISNMANIIYVRQKEPLGLGHAILCAKECIGNEPFGIILGDDIVSSKIPALKQLIDTYNDKKASVLGVQRIPMEDTYKYGIVDPISQEGCVHKAKALVEKPKIDVAPSNLAILGRYIVTPKLFDILENTKPGVGGEIQLTDALNALIKEEDVYACEFEGKRYDVGDKLGFLKATCEFALKRDDLKKEFKQYLTDLIGGKIK